MALSLHDPYATDRTPIVTLEIDGREYRNVKDYTYQSDVLSLADPFRVTLGSPDGDYGGTISEGSSVKVRMADPEVEGGTSVTKLTGIVTALEMSAARGTGTTLTVQGSDLGWHLVNNTAPLWFRLNRVSWKKLLEAVLDKSWGFAGVRDENTTNTKLKLGRAGIQIFIQTTEHDFAAIIPPIQIEPGQMIADTLVHYAKLSKLLVNVSSDGYLQLFRPREVSLALSSPALYSFRHHSSESGDPTENNVESARLSRSLDGLYTEIVCVGTVVRKPLTENIDDPNRMKFRGEFKDTKALPFTRRLTFTDGEMLTRSRATKRAEWRAKRGVFDSFTLEYVVTGHSQNGLFYEPDTICEVDDTVLGVKGYYYVSAVRYQRTMQAGTTTTLTIKKPNLLSA